MRLAMLATAASSMSCDLVSCRSPRVCEERGVARSHHSHSFQRMMKLRGAGPSSLVYDLCVRENAVAVTVPGLKDGASERAAGLQRLRGRARAWRERERERERRKRLSQRELLVKTEHAETQTRESLETKCKGLEGVFSLERERERERNRETPFCGKPCAVWSCFLH